MPKKIALIGHCGPDASYLRMAVKRAAGDAQIVAAEDAVELEQLIKDGVDLLLFNRMLDYGFEETEGAAMIGKLHARHPNLKMILVSNYPEAQAQAVAAGALPGFGKREMNTPRVTEIVRQALEQQTSHKSA